MKTRIKKFLSELDTEIDVLNYVEIDNIDYSDAYKSIYEMIDENSGFDIEIIYNSNAMNYLSENDPSLCASLGLAADLGYEANDLNSEILASLLASKNARRNFCKLENEINGFFAELGGE